MSILMADSHCSMAEINTTLKSNYPPVTESSIDISTVSILREPWSRMHGNLSHVALVSEKTILAVCT